MLSRFILLLLRLGLWNLPIYFVYRSDRVKMNALEKLITEMGVREALPFLKRHNLGIIHLKVMKECDLEEIFPPNRIRETFRKKLLEWQMMNWIPDGEPPPRTVLNKSLRSLLLESAKGKNILTRFQEKKVLSNQDRVDFISLMVDDIYARNIHISTSDFRYLLDEICKLFPGEEEMRDFYFIERRQSGGNPSGKLYSKYKNMRYRMRVKKVKLNDPIKSSAPQSSSDVSLDNIIKQEKDEEDNDCTFDSGSIQNAFVVTMVDTRTSNNETSHPRAYSTSIESTQKDAPENPFYSAQIIKEEVEFTKYPFDTKSMQDEHDFTMDDSRASKDETTDSTVTAKPSETTEKDATEKPTESPSPVVNYNEASLKAIAEQIKSLNKTTKDAKESILSMGSRICLLLEKGLEERQKHNALLAKLLEKNFNE